MGLAEAVAGNKPAHKAASAGGYGGGGGGGGGGGLVAKLELNILCKVSQFAIPADGAGATAA